MSTSAHHQAVNQRVVGKDLDRGDGSSRTDSTAVAAELIGGRQPRR
jgi:hypothetical protein